MKNLLINIGIKSKKAFTKKLNSKKKDKVLIDYYQLINKNRKLIINQNKKDIKNAKKIVNQILCIPIHEKLKQIELKYVYESINYFVNKYGI